jgi:hypothetical protein
MFLASTPAAEILDLLEPYREALPILQPVRQLSCGLAETGQLLMSVS